MRLTTGCLILSLLASSAILPACGEAKPAQTLDNESSIPIQHPTGSSFEIASPLGGEPVKVQVVAAGNGRLAKRNRTVVMDFIGRVAASGKQFVSSKDRGLETFRPGAGAVIQGWDMAAQQMRQGDHWKVTIPAPLAYAGNGGPIVPPNAAVVMELWVREVK